MIWVNENYRSYAYRHTLGLLNLVLNSPSIMHMATTSKRFKDAVTVIDLLYDVDKGSAERGAGGGTGGFGGGAGGGKGGGETDNGGGGGGGTKMLNMFSTSAKPTAFPRPHSTSITRTGSVDDMDGREGRDRRESVGGKGGWDGRGGAVGVDGSEAKAGEGAKGGKDGKEGKENKKFSSRIAHHFGMSNS